MTETYDREFTSSGSPAAPPRRTAGFTLLEMIVAIALMAILVGSVGFLMLRTQNLSSELMTQLRVNDTCVRIMSRMRRELQGVEPTTVLPLILDDSPTVQFQTVTGYDAGVVEMGPVITIGFQLAAGEADNGTDDNGDGRADEGGIVYVVAGQPPIVLSEDILGLRFNQTANGLSFTADVGVLNRDGLLVTETITQSVAFRN